MICIFRFIVHNQIFENILKKIKLIFVYDFVLAKFSLWFRNVRQFEFSFYIHSTDIDARAVRVRVECYFGLIAMKLYLQLPLNDSAR